MESFWPLSKANISRTNYSENGPCLPLDFHWTFLTHSGIESTPVVIQKKVFIGNHNGSIYALDAETGVRFWNCRIKGDILTPCTDGKRLYAVTYLGEIYALSCETGEILWQKKYFSLSEPVILEERLFVGTIGYLMVLDPHSGEEVTRLSPKEERGTISSPALDEEIITFYSPVALYSYEFGTNQLLFKKNLLGLNTRHHPVIAGDLILAVTAKEGIRAVNKRTGEEKWSFRAKWALDETPPTIVSQLAVQLDSLGNVYALNLSSGEVVWSQKNAFIDLSESKITAIKNYLYIATPKKRFICLDLEGRVVWNSPLNHEIGFSHSIGEQRIFIPFKDGRLQCLGPWVKETLREDIRPLLLNCLKLFNNKEITEEFLLSAKKAMELIPHHPLPYFFLGEYFYQANQYNNSFRCFEKFLNWDFIEIETEWDFDNLTHLAQDRISKLKEFIQ